MKILSFILMIIMFNTVLASPYELNLKKELQIGYMTLGLGLGTLIAGDNGTINEDEILKLDKDDINFFDRSACENYSESSNDISTILLLGTVASPILLGVSDKIRDDYQTISLIYFETLVLTYTTTKLTKNLIKRERPYLYNDKSDLKTKLDDDSAKNSFFSGHSSIAFASAMFVSKVYSDYNPESRYRKYIYAGSFFTASTIGYLRYRAGKHYPSDIIAGALVGSFYGYYIPEFHKKKERELIFAPAVDNKTYGFTAIFKF